VLDPKNLRSVDEATALGIAALWNDAIPNVLHMLDHQVDDIRDGIRLALECDRDDCETHDARHRDNDEECYCWGCQNAGLLTMAQDTRHWLNTIEDGTASPDLFEPHGLLGRVTDWLYVNDHAPRLQAPAHRLGAVYRLLAELADQTRAEFDAAYSAAGSSDPWGGDSPGAA
jgi:hypothetical protein